MKQFCKRKANIVQPDLYSENFISENGLQRRIVEKCSMFIERTALRFIKLEHSS
jgi:hypothetical protein